MLKGKRGRRCKGYEILNWKGKKNSCLKQPGVELRHDDGIGIGPLPKFESGAVRPKFQRNVNWQLPCRDNIFRATFRE
jgi:hypothetical protein